MADYKQTFINVVVLGNLNPQILNHDWLVKQRILPTGVSPSNKDHTETPFTQYVSIPQMATLAYGPLVFTVELNKFVLQNNTPTIDLRIFKTAQRYFEKLPHTPVKKLGYNVHGVITFSTEEEERNFDNKFVSYNSTLSSILGATDIHFGFTALYSQDSVLYRLECSKSTDHSEAHINFNCEFDVDNVESMLPFLGEAKKYIRKIDKHNRTLANL
jgi:hypothetical protein